VAPRAYWKGYLKLSLVSCPVALFPASSEREKIRFHQINKATGNRIKYRKVDAETDEDVDTSDIVKGYEVGKGEYIELEPEELEAVAVESTRTLEIDEFVPKKEIDELYLNNPYYVVPDGDVGQQAFAVIREAIRKEGMVALGRVVFTSREHVIALEPRGKGLLGITLRYPYEIRKEAFDLGVRRKRLLDGGTIKYRADDRLYRKDKVAISCFHAMAGLDELYPNGGLFGTGFKMWGFNGTARVLIEYSEKASNKGLLLDPVDVKKDRFVFVYAPTAGGPVPYNPAKSAAAYHR